MIRRRMRSIGESRRSERRWQQRSAGVRLAGLRQGWSSYALHWLILRRHRALEGGRPLRKGFGCTAPRREPRRKKIFKPMQAGQHGPLSAGSRQCERRYECDYRANLVREVLRLVRRSGTASSMLPPTCSVGLTASPSVVQPGNWSGLAIRLLARAAEATRASTTWEDSRPTAALVAIRRRRCLDRTCERCALPQAE